MVNNYPDAAFEASAGRNNWWRGCSLYSKEHNSGRTLDADAEVNVGTIVMVADHPFYGLANFSEGSAVRIADRGVLEDFLASWRYHHKLEPEQLAYAGKVAKVVRIFMYHGGDILYELENVPGCWHQQLLKVVS